MKILDSTKTLTQLASDTTNGIGHISPLSCVVTEVLNGEYEAEITVSANDKYFGSLNVGSLLEIELDAIRGKQIFEIYFIGKPINEIVSIKCQHITYRLNKVPVGAFSSTGAVSSVNNLLSHVIGTTEFTMTTDITNTTSNFSLDIPRYFREILGGYEGSMLDVFRGEYEWDNLTIRMLAHRGSDNGVRIAYGKNLTDFNQEENNQEVYTSVLGYAKVDDVLYTGNVYDKIVSTNQRVKIVDFSSDYESGQTPTVSELTDKAEAYADRNDIENPQVNITISFVPLYQTEEYKNIAPLERVNLGDTVHVFFDKLGVEASSRVVKTVWNVLTQKYDSVELGSVKANLNTVINESVEDATKDILNNLEIDTGFIENELAEMGELVVNGLGLFITRNVLIDGSERIVLHNKPALVDSNIQYYISANGLVVSTDYGQTWNAGITPQGDAVLNALSANIIRALQIYGSFLRFGDVSSNYIDVAPYSENDVPQGVSFDGTGSIRMRPKGELSIYNTSANSQKYNELIMNTTTGSLSELVPQVSLTNYDINGREATMLRLLSVNNVLGLSNRAELTNYYRNNNARKTGNSFSMQTSTTNATEIILSNANTNNDIKANRIWMQHQTNNYNGITLTNYRGDTENVANSITMEYTSEGGRNLILQNYDANNEWTNLIQLGYQSGITLRAKQDNITIYVDNGNITLTASSNMYISAPNIYMSGSALYWNNQQKW